MVILTIAEVHFYANKEPGIGSDDMEYVKAHPKGYRRLEGLQVNQME